MHLNKTRLLSEENDIWKSELINSTGSDRYLKCIHRTKIEYYITNVTSTFKTHMT